MKTLSFIIALLIILLSGCSVFMAAKKEGISIDELSQCRTRSCVISKGAVPTKTEKTEEGDTYWSLYRSGAKGFHRPCCHARCSRRFHTGYLGSSWNSNGRRYGRKEALFNQSNIWQGRKFKECRDVAVNSSCYYYA